MKTAQYIAEFLSRIGIERVYTLSGGMIAPLLDAIGEHPAMRLVTVSHEQSAAFAAENEAKVSARPGVAIGTNGPGALNLVTGIASAYCDSVPCLFFAGQVQTYLSRTVPGGRQSGLQQVDFASVCRPIVKDAIVVGAAKDVPAAISRAYVTAMSGRPGPVVLEVPFDVQQGEVGENVVAVPKIDPEPGANSGDVRRLARDLVSSAFPVVLIGGGAHGAEVQCRRIIESFSIPIACTTAGLDVVSGAGALFVGMCGMYGTRAANTILSEADLVLALGTRLDHAVLGGDASGFARKRKVWQVDLDSAEVGARARPSEGLVGDIGATLLELEESLRGCGFAVKADWLSRVASILNRFPTTAEYPDCEGINPSWFAQCLGRYSTPAAAYVVDAGQHTWWSGQSITLAPRQRFLTSTGLHACGTAIPGAIGAAMYLKRPVVVIAGDGAIQLNIQDLATITRERLPIKTIVINNQAHGSVRQLQVELSPGRYHAALWGLSKPNLSAIFSAYGIPSLRITRPDEVEEGLKWLWVEEERAQMLEVMVDPELLVRPAVPFGRQISNMVPVSPGT